MKRFATLCIIFCVVIIAKGQNYMGMSGLINVPSAEMNDEGDAVIGAYYLDKSLLPDDAFMYDGKKFNTADFYASITPFKWIELCYTFTLMRAEANGNYTDKDRQFAVKLNPLREGKYHPAIAIGCNDVQGAIRIDLKNGSNDGTNDFFTSYYIVATKHFNISNETIGVNVAYRHCSSKHIERWQGVVGGLTYVPSFAKNVRVIAEYTGNEVNAGIDCLLWKHLFLQAVLTDGQHFSGGVCYKVNLLR